MYFTKSTGLRKLVCNHSAWTRVQHLQWTENCWSYFNFALFWQLYLTNEWHHPEERAQIYDCVEILEYATSNRYFHSYWKDHYWAVYQFLKVIPSSGGIFTHLFYLFENERKTRPCRTLLYFQFGHLFSLAFGNSNVRNTVGPDRNRRDHSDIICWALVRNSWKYFQLVSSLHFLSRNAIDIDWRRRERYFTGSWGLSIHVVSFSLFCCVFVCDYIWHFIAATDAVIIACGVYIYFWHENQSKMKQNTHCSMCR